MTANRTEVIAGLILLAFSIFAWNEASQLQSAGAMFPRGIIAVLGFFSLVYLLRSVFNGHASEPVFKHTPIFFITLIGSIVYVQLVIAIGYVTSTLVFIPLLSWIIGFRRPVYIAVVTVLYIASVHLLFEVVFNRPMPDDLALQLLKGIF